MDTQFKTAAMKRAFLLLNIIILAIGNCGGPLVMRLYFIHGGKRVWFVTWLETAAWPVILLPITIGYLHRRRTQPSSPTKLFFIKPPLFMASAVIGILTGLDDYFFAYGLARVPVSTAALLIASQLAFTAGFAFVLVKQKFTSYSINAIFLLTLGAVILALHTNNDRPNGESHKEYMLGFVMTVGAAALYGFVLPLIELAYKKGKQDISYALVLEIQMILSLFATLFATVGMLVNNDFKVIGREAREFELGEGRYYVLAVGSSLIWQCFFLGAIGIIFCASSLLSGIVLAVLLPVTEILAVIFYKEKFQAEKGVSLVLSIWGFLSYFYGEIKHNKKKKKQEDQTPESDMPQISNNPC
ncbi:hypothetical protein ACOSP7_010224 [Xanthoceras sorbifolium]